MIFPASAKEETTAFYINRYLLSNGSKIRLRSSSGQLSTYIEVATAAIFSCIGDSLATSRQLKEE